MSEITGLTSSQVLERRKQGLGNDVKLSTIAAGVLIVAYLALLLIAPLRAFFDLVALPVSFTVAIAVVTIVWVLVQRAVWRSRLFERFLDIEDSIAIGWALRFMSHVLSSSNPGSFEADRLQLTDRGEHLS
jgi:hypothetical protein